MSCDIHCLKKSLFFVPSEIPNRPLNVRVIPVRQSNHTSKPIHRMLNVSWDVPDNIEQFDLERYKVHVSISQLETGNHHNYSHGTDSNFVFLPHHHFAHITVTAVSKCLQESAESDPVELASSVGEAEHSFSVILPTKQATTNNVKAAAHNGRIILRYYVLYVSSLSLCLS